MTTRAARHRRLLALWVLAAVAVASVCGLLWKVRASEAASTSYNYPQLTQSPPGVAVPTVAFIGDSYSAGTGSSGYNSRFTTLVAAYEGWSSSSFAYGGTGYLRQRNGASRETGCNSEHCPNYPAVLQAVKTYNPSIVFVSGGRNDVGLPPNLVVSAINRFYTNLHAALPHARIIVTSPMWAYSDPPPQLVTIQAAVRAAARRAGATYLNLGEPLVKDRALVSGDHVHPNDRGHAAIAHAVEVALSNTRQTSPTP